MFAASYMRSTCQYARSFSLGKAIGKSHYDALGVPPTATQADIKDAYYKLSMLYHPDKVTTVDDDTVKKFHDITEAYEVLRNIRLRRLYDKGATHIAVVDEPLSKFYQSRERRSRPPSTGRTPIYDFDEWSRQHYSVLIQKQKESKENIRREEESVKHEAENLRMSRVLLVMVLMLGAFGYLSEQKNNLLHERPVSNK